MRILENCKPERVYYWFEEIAKIPHGSRNTKAISDYLAAFAAEHQLRCIQDPCNNIIIFKGATSGYEDADPVILQGHMDMVCEKESDVSFDFEKDGLSLCVDGDFVRAAGTTLGGDDGIAVAYALAILEADDILHPALEVVITVDEEIGMLGAYGMDMSVLKGRKMLNLDSEEEGYFLTSCAGGVSLHQTIPVMREQATGQYVKVTLTGLLGGHSGAEIHKNRANAVIEMGKILRSTSCSMEVFNFLQYTYGNETDIKLISMYGGLKDNAIPRECTAEFLIPSDLLEEFSQKFQSMAEYHFEEQFKECEPGYSIRIEPGEERTANVLTESSKKDMLKYLDRVPNGVQKFSEAMPELVESSINLGIFELKENEISMVTSVRSCVAKEKIKYRDRIARETTILGGTYEYEGDYPAWEYKEDSVVREQMADVYRELFGKEPVFQAIHAGLECGIFSERLPGLDCVSFGPDILDIHTPKERLSISSTERVWRLLLAFLAKCR